MKKLKVFLLFFISVFLLIPTVANAKINDVSPYHYVYNNDSLLTRTNIDEISSIGEMLSLKDIELIVNVANENKGTDNSECRDIFYTYLKDKNFSNSQKPKRIIPISIYKDTKNLFIYDDYGILNPKFIEDLNKKVNSYISNNNIDKGVIYAYKSIAKELNKELNLGIKSIDDLELDDTYTKKNLFSIKNIFLFAALIIVVIGFRRNKVISA